MKITLKAEKTTDNERVKCFIAGLGRVGWASVVARFTLLHTKYEKIHHHMQMRVSARFTISYHHHHPVVANYVFTIIVPKRCFIAKTHTHSGVNALMGAFGWLFN